MTKPLKEKVKKHLETRKDVDPAALPDPVVDALNALEDQIDKVDDLGKALMDAQKLTNATRISAVH
jgi:hypothetical protein